MYRQGDVLIIPVDEQIPNHAQKVDREDGRVILAHGEVTGHAHAIGQPQVAMFQADAGWGGVENVNRWLKVEQPAVVEHEEHAPISLAPGNYRVVRQREYEPGSRSARFVGD